MSYPSAPPPGPAPGTTRLLWVLVGLLVVAIVVVVALQLRDEDGRDAPDVLPTPTEEGPPVLPEPSPEPTEEPTPDAMPLLGPEESRLVDGASKIPASDTSLEDGDYFGILRGIDPAAGTVDVDIAIFYVGSAAEDWLTANDPTAENPPPNDHIIVNEVERIRTLPIAAGAAVWAWCYLDGSEGLPFVKLTVAQWASAPDGGEPTCTAGTSIGRDPSNLYWFDVRGGVVQQVVGQYVP
jgi:hypothetical protein